MHPSRLEIGKTYRMDGKRIKYHEFMPAEETDDIDLYIFLPFIEGVSHPKETTALGFTFGEVQSRIREDGRKRRQ
ncbi:hypothetical protein KBD71_01165 [Candidatus Woesebacteria bacterium]|nr:hypothetical protein [Candidatus Woesebacteria bacterium]